MQYRFKAGRGFEAGKSPACKDTLIDIVECDRNAQADWTFYNYKPSGK
ncbi:hypothetical protein [Paraburkholderia adhaesiva]|nr:hypothetical protein [Paraburkholderia adhaesiva]